MIYKALSAYSAASQTLPKLTQVVMLYEASITSVIKAKQAIEEGDFESRYNHIKKAYEIIDGLQSSLDFDSAKEISHVLFDFYTTVLHELSDIQNTNSTAICDSVVSELKHMKDVWLKIKNQTNQDYSQSSMSMANNPAIYTA